jgi:fructoselysine-6-P-deglycase FrlB-like protein
VGNLLDYARKLNIKTKIMQNLLTHSFFLPIVHDMSDSFNTELEVASQPDIWRQVAQFAPEAIHRLPQRGEKVAVVGCGTSWFMAMAYAALREAAGHGLTDVYAGSQYNHNRNYDRIVLISRSGTTTEIIDLLATLKTPSVALTSIHGSRFAELASDAIVMDFADEKSIIQTRWATAALGLLRTSLGFDLNSIIADAETAVASDLSRLAGVDQITFLGSGWTIGLAHEAALKTREAGQFWAEAYPHLEYRHGPLSVSQPGRAVWAFGELPQDLIRDIEGTGAILETSTLDPMAHLIRAQRLAVEIAKARNLDADFPRGLTRSIILTK